MPCRIESTFAGQGDRRDLFGQRHGEDPESCLASIETLLYPNVTSRTVHLLYFIIKNYPLIAEK